MKPEYAEQISIIASYHQDNLENRQARARLDALIATDAVAAAEAQVDAARAQLEASRAAAQAADKQASNLVKATWALAFATVGLLIATGVLVYITAKNGGG